MVMASQLLPALALLAGTRFLTELVSPEIFGRVALLSGVAALGVAVFSYPVIGAGMRMAPECKNHRERALLNQVVWGLTIRSTVLATIVLLLAGFVFCYLTGLEIGLFILTALLLMVTVRRELGVTLLIAERKTRVANLWLMSDSIFRPLAAVWLVWGLGQSSEAVLLGYVIATVVSNTLWTIVNGQPHEKRSINPPISISHYKHHVCVFALSLIPMELIYWVNGLGDRFVIGSMLTAHEVGVFIATCSIIHEIFNRGAMILMRAFQPIYLRLFANNKSKDAYSMLWLWIVSVVGFGTVGVFVVLMAKEALAGLLLAKSYHLGIELMPAIAFGSALSAFGTVMAQPLLAKKQTQTLLKGRICGALVSVICLPVLVSYFGLSGAAMANPIYFGIEALVLVLLAKPWNRSYSAAGNQVEFAHIQPAVHDYESLTEKSIVLSAES